MKSTEVKLNTSGLFYTLLQVAFIVLKLTHVIDWSWWWVFAPTIVQVGIAILVLVGIVIAAVKENK
jgi:hypothetical protein